jgi:zinc/manganese transport system permease protein
VSLRLVSTLFLVIVSVAVAEATQIVGVLLIFALMIGPAATASALTSRLGRGILLAVLLALIETWLGLVLAYHTDWPTSFWISALCTLFYVGGMAFAVLKDRRPAVAAVERAPVPSATTTPAADSAAIRHPS